MPWDVNHLPVRIENCFSVGFPQNSRVTMCKKPQTAAPACRHACMESEGHGLPITCFHQTSRAVATTSSAVRASASVELKVEA